MWYFLGLFGFFFGRWGELSDLVKVMWILRVESEVEFLFFSIKVRIVIVIMKVFWKILRIMLM